MLPAWLHMHVLDRYIVGKFLRTFGFSLLICSMISVVIDFSDKVQNFVDKKPPFKEILIDYYLGFILHMAGLLMPLYVLIAVVFFTSRMAADSEIISMFNAGMSFKRILRPYLIAGLLIGGAHLLTSHFLIPLANKNRLKFEHTYVWLNQEKVKGSNALFMISPTEQVYVRSFDKSSKSARDFRLQRFNGSTVTNILEAKEATWIDSLKTWRMSNYTMRSFDGLKETYTRSGAGKLDTAINLSATDFTWFQNENEEMTSPELAEAAQRDKSRGSGLARNYEIEIQRRTAEAFTIVILTVIGLAMAGRKVRGGIGLHLAMAIGIGALFILLSKFAVSFAANGVLHPAVAMWIPNLIFGIVAVYLVVVAQK
jgi:lipopolysaccharide export system permease protein